MQVNLQESIAMNAVEVDVAPPAITHRGLSHPELEVVAHYLPRVLGVRTDHRRIPNSGDRVRVAVLRGEEPLFSNSRHCIAFR